MAAALGLAAEPVAVAVLRVASCCWLSLWRQRVTVLRFAAVAESQWIADTGLDSLAQNCMSHRSAMAPHRLRQQLRPVVTEEAVRTTERSRPGPSRLGTELVQVSELMVPSSLLPSNFN